MTITPTQADRDAAADLAAQFQKYTYVQVEAPAIRCGDHDDWNLVQAFTLHAQRAREQALDEAAAYIECEGMTTNHAGVPVMAEVNQVLAASIRALKEGRGDE